MTFAVAHDRMSLQFDAVDANAFDEASASVEGRDDLLLARISTTPSRLDNCSECTELKKVIGLRSNWTARDRDHARGNCLSPTIMFPNDR
jgi:hypothetical protein